MLTNNKDYVNLIISVSEFIFLYKHYTNYETYDTILIIDFTKFTQRLNYVRIFRFK